MANARALDNRRKSVRNIKKITRTMELIATARFKQAMDRAMAATGYTQRITQVVNDLAKSGLDVSHPLLEKREEIKSTSLLIFDFQPWTLRRIQRKRFKSLPAAKISPRIRVRVS